MFFSIWKLSSNSWNEWNKYKEVWSWSSGSTISGHPLGPWAGLSPNWEDLSDCRPTQDQKGGEAGYFYRVVPNVLDINRLLTDLTVKEEPDLVQWKEPCEWAFCQVKQVVLFGGLLLHSPDFFLPFVLQIYILGAPDLSVHSELMHHILIKLVKQYLIVLNSFAIFKRRMRH